MNENTKDILDSLAFIKDHMLTKDEARDMLRDELAPIRAELKEIRGELEGIQKDLENASGYAKEIDHALARIARIEKHLGLDKKVAA